MTQAVYLFPILEEEGVSAILKLYPNLATLRVSILNLDFLETFVTFTSHWKTRNERRENQLEL